MKVQTDKYMGINVGDTVVVLVGGHVGALVKVIEIELDAGARNGWFTCRGLAGFDLLLAGEEIAKVVG